jgi:hypothetical protein
MKPSFNDMINIKQGEIVSEEKSYVLLRPVTDGPMSFYIVLSDES